MSLVRAAQLFVTHSDLGINGRVGDTRVSAERAALASELPRVALFADWIRHTEKRRSLGPSSPNLLDVVILLNASLERDGRADLCTDAPGVGILAALVALGVRPSYGRTLRSVRVPVSVSDLWRIRRGLGRYAPARPAGARLLTFDYSLVDGWTPPLHSV